MSCAGSDEWLGHVRIPLKDYKQFVRDTTLSLCRGIEGPAVDAKLYHFVNNLRESKEKIALQMAAERKQSSGLIAVLGCVEPCQTVQVRKNRETKMLELQVEQSRCKHYYHYHLDPNYGLRYTRLQTWFPFTMHVGLNGRDWLAQQLTKAGIDFRKLDNSFSWIEDFAAAQKLADEQLETDWLPLLDQWVAQSHRLAEGFLPCHVPYYWSLETGDTEREKRASFGREDGASRRCQGPIVAPVRTTTALGPRFFLGSSSAHDSGCGVNSDPPWTQFACELPDCACGRPGHRQMVR